MYKLKKKIGLNILYSYMLWRRAWDDHTDYLAEYLYQDTHLSPVFRDNYSTHSNSFGIGLFLDNTMVFLVAV